MTDVLSERHEGSGFAFAHPPAASIEIDPEPTALESVVVAGAAEPLLVAAALEESPLDTAALQVPGLLGQVLHKYEALGGYELRRQGRITVPGSDGAEVAEITYGEGDPRQALIVSARVAGARVVTLQVHFPPSRADTLLPVALAVVASLTITA